jgi:hypothetical protein
MTRTVPVADSSPGLLDRRALGSEAVRPIHCRIRSGTVLFPMTLSTHDRQEEKGNDRSSAS